MGGWRSDGRHAVNAPYPDRCATCRTWLPATNVAVVIVAGRVLCQRCGEAAQRLLNQERDRTPWLSDALFMSGTLPTVAFVVVSLGLWWVFLEGALWVAAVIGGRT